MKLRASSPEHDGINLQILDMLQEDCKVSLATIGERVGLSAPAVIERIRKLEEAGIIRGYAALLDGRQLGKDVTAFIGITSLESGLVESLEREIACIEDTMEVHHLTGPFDLLVKVKTESTATLERIIRRLRLIEGVTRTETMIVLSTHTERWRIPLHLEEETSEGTRGPRRTDDGPCCTVRTHRRKKSGGSDPNDCNA